MSSAAVVIGALRVKYLTHLADALMDINEQQALDIACWKYNKLIYSLCFPRFHIKVQFTLHTSVLVIIFFLHS